MVPQFSIYLSNEHRDADMTHTKISMLVGKCSSFTNLCSDFTVGASVFHSVKEHENTNVTSNEIPI